MADTNIIPVFQNLAAEMANVSSALSAQGISQMVQTFDGNPRNFRDWVKQIEKYCQLTNLPDTRKRMVAFQASKGAVSGYIGRYMEAYPHNTWVQLKTELAKRFSDITDSQYALSLLRSIKQKPGENIQLFAERLVSLAEEAFEGQGNDAIERQLIDTFVDGLTNNDALKMKILRDNPNTLQAAISIATKEQNLRARVNLSNNFHFAPRSERRETPMEIDHSRQLKCFKCKKIGHTAKNCKVVNHVYNETVQNPRVNRKIICWGCGQEGHIIRTCRQRQQGRQNDKPNVGHGQRIPSQEN